MSHSADDGNPKPTPNPITHPTNHLSPSTNPQSSSKELSLKHALLKMQLHSFSSNHSPPYPQSPRSLPPETSDTFSDHSVPLKNHDPESLSGFSDEILLKIFAKVPLSQCFSNSLVSKRWLHLNGRLVRSLKLLDWGFLESGRVFHRFPNLIDIDLVRACIRPSKNSGVIVTHKFFVVHANTEFLNFGFDRETNLLPSNLVDKGLRLLAEGYPNLRRIVVIGASENGLSSIAHDCDTLQELELHCCDDMSLKGISGCENLQIVKLIGSVGGFYSSVVSDIGLTILAQGCRRLVKLELCGCEGSYDGIKAIGQCCVMLEELTFCDHRMDGGWLAALSFCGNLKTLRLQSCKVIDLDPGSDEHLGSCPTLEELYVQRCQMRDKMAVKALFLVCEAVREIVLQDCWGMGNEVFSFVSICRRLKFLLLEGCSLLTMAGLESVILSLKDLQSLKVESCNNIKDGEMSPAVSSLFSMLKELKWRPDSRFLLSSSLAETGVGNRGGRFFNRVKP